MLFQIWALLILLYDVHPSQSLHAKIGNYENITAIECGLSGKQLIAKRLSLLHNSVSDKAINESNFVNEKETLEAIFLSKTKIKKFAKLTEGNTAIIGEFPWMASFQKTKTNRHFCGGAVINEWWIITAAHCFKHNKQTDNFYIRIGSNKLDGGQIVSADKFILHPKYNVKIAGLYDIALVKLDKQINLKSEPNYIVNGVCLPEDGIENTEQEVAYFSGFGKLDYSGTQPLKLQKSEFILYSDQKCRRYVKGINLACLNTRHKHTCEGDSGSPLVQYVNNRAVLIGIHKGSKGKIKGKCGVGVARTNRISKYVHWINDTILNN